MNNLLSR